MTLLYAVFMALLHLEPSCKISSVWRCCVLGGTCSSRLRGRFFDANGNGAVDLPELSAGLAVLCSGARDDKVRARRRLCSPQS
jgi:hypothetical protein